MTGVMHYTVVRCLPADSTSLLDALLILQYTEFNDIVHLDTGGGKKENYIWILEERQID
jgi:hypothetical protein